MAGVCWSIMDGICQPEMVDIADGDVPLLPNEDCTTWCVKALENLLLVLENILAIEENMHTICKERCSVVLKVYNEIIKI